MSTIIVASNGAGATAPDIVIEYDAARQPRSTVHDLLAGGVIVVHAPARPASGTMRLAYLDRAAAFEALELFGTASTFTLSDDDVPEIGHLFAITGGTPALSWSSSDETWTLTLPFQTVTESTPGGGRSIVENPSGSGIYQIIPPLEATENEGIFLAP